MSQKSALRFLDEMFVVRGYNLATKRIVYLKKKKMYEVFISDGEGRKIMCVLTPVSVNAGEVSDETDEVMHDLLQEQEQDPAFEGSNSSVKNNNIGTDFIKSILCYGVAHSVQVIILISDVVTAHALRAISNANINIVHFKYVETSIRQMSSHINQPVVFRKLSDFEKKIYTQKNPLFAKELQRYAHSDPLIKYFGMNVGDIIEYEDSDRQSGLVKEHGIVVDEF
jgi:DNA-directed RNA polymerase subunit H (RpoH/RPB5)